MADYPLGMDGRGKPGGRVRVLEDTDADGRYDRQTLFADGLSFPTGLLTWRDGVLAKAPARGYSRSHTRSSKKGGNCFN